MFIINVAEWCVELLVLGLAFFFIAVGILIFMMIIGILKELIDRKINESIRNN